MSGRHISGACLTSVFQENDMHCLGGTVWARVSEKGLRNVLPDRDCGACLETLIELVLDGKIFWDPSANLVY